MEIIYKDLSRQIIGCVFDFFRDLGPGYDEFTYHQGLKMRFEKERLSFLSKPQLSLHYRGVEIAKLVPDFIIDDKIVLEIKAIQTDLLPENYKQIISYLRLTNKRLGILINFGLLQANFKRIPFDERPLKIVEDFAEIRPAMNEEASRLREGILNIAKELRLGYHAELYQEVMKVELKLGKFSWNEKVKVPVTYQNVLLNNCEIDYWLVNSKILLAVLAGSKEVRAYDVMRMRTYLKGLNLNIGLIAFWGKDHLCIRGVGPLR